MKALNADLAPAQVFGFPIGGYQPAVRCRFWSNNAIDFFDFSFDPTVATNRLLYVQHIEEPQNDSGVILLSNYDKSIPANLIGYLIHLGWGLNTPDGIKNKEADGAVAPALWVVKQSDISGGVKGQKPELYTIFELRGVWQAVLNAQPIRLGPEPYYWHYVDVNESEAGADNIPELANKTIFECLKYLIETSLSEQTGLGFFLDDLGDQDDGKINDINVENPFPSGEVSLLYDETTEIFGTYGSFISKLMSRTDCYLRTEPGLTFKVIYPQESDGIDETYYSDSALGHPFYEINHGRIGERSAGTPLPNHIQIFGGEHDITGLPLYEGHWFDPDHYTTPPTTFTPAAIEAAYTGDFMPVTFEGNEEDETWDKTLTSNAQCVNTATTLGLKMKAITLGTRLLIPMDASLELYDRVSVEDTRGL